MLEVGCWSGHVTQHLVARGNSVVGVELDPEAARLAEAHAEHVHVADVDRVALSSLEDGPFDVIMFGDVLEHLRDPHAVLADAAGLLAPDGRFVISIPNVSHIDARMMLLQGGWDYQPDGLLDRTHLRWFTPRSLRELLAGVGFVANRVERVSTPFGSTNLVFDRHAVGPELVRFASADPEANTLQLVVEASRTGEDALAGDAAVAWPAIEDSEQYRRRIAELEAERDALADRGRGMAQLQAGAGGGAVSQRVRAPAPPRRHLMAAPAQPRSRFGPGCSPISECCKAAERPTRSFP